MDINEKLHLAEIAHEHADSDLMACARAILELDRWREWVDGKAAVAGTYCYAESLAKAFHETYERLSPQFGYKPEDAPAVPWGAVPEHKRNLMIAVAHQVLNSLKADPSISGVRGLENSSDAP